MPCLLRWTSLSKGRPFPEAYLNVLPGPLLANLTGCPTLRCNREHGAPNASPLLKLQIIRAIACNIVKHRDFYPTKEVLLKHALGYMGMLDEFKGEKTQQATSCLFQWLLIISGMWRAGSWVRLNRFSVDLAGELGEQGGKIDNPDDFLADMPQLDKFEQKMVCTRPELFAG
jgi:hypothetical protein